jgi:hypothetical protein
VYNLDSVNRDDDAIVSEPITLSAGNHATAPVRVFFFFLSFMRVILAHQNLSSGLFVFETSPAARFILGFCR